MSIDDVADKVLSDFRHPQWLLLNPLGAIFREFVGHLVMLQYDQMTIHHYLSAVAHFNFWASSRHITISDITKKSIDTFLDLHLPACTCPAPRFRGRREIGTAMRHVIRLLEANSLVKLTAAAPEGYFAAELQAFRKYLSSSCGLAESTCSYELKVVALFLEETFGKTPINLSQIPSKRLSDWIVGLATRYSHGTIRRVCSSLRSYFRFRKMRGDSLDALAAGLPLFPHKEERLITTLSDADLARFLECFDLSAPTGLRDFAIARCLCDLGLRAQEATQLALDDIDWRAATVTVRRTKGRRERVLPLPVVTGQAIARYLRDGRPRCAIRRLFIRNGAPVDKPLQVAAIRGAIVRAFARCGLDDRFGGPHVLRRTLATQLQRCGTPLKSIADVLGHQQLQTTTRYAGVDFEQLRKVSLPWPA